MPCNSIPQLGTGRNNPLVDATIFILKDLLSKRNDLSSKRTFRGAVARGDILKININYFAAIIFILYFLTTPLAAEDPVCEHCGMKIISNNFISVNGKYYHKEHFLCAYCGKVIDGGFNFQDGKFYHNKCYNEHIVTRCSVCGAIIDGKYGVDIWGNKYCWDHHENDEPRCCFCNRFISNLLTNGGVVYSDGRIVCNQCRESAVMHLGKLNRYLSPILKTAARYGIELDVSDINFDMRDIDTTGAQKKISGSDQYGLTHCLIETQGPDTTYSCSIYLAYGMPEYIFIQTLAHELMHIWMYHNCIGNQNIALSEGSANYFAFLILKDTDNPEADKAIRLMEKSGHAAYGAGFLSVREFAEKNGIDQWLEYIKTHKNLP